MNQEKGQILRQARTQKQLSVDALYEQTRISPAIIQAFERGEDGALPAVHQRAFLRALAHALDIDPDEILTGSSPGPNAEETQSASAPPALGPWPAWLKRYRMGLLAVFIVGPVLAWIVSLYIMRGPALFQNAPVSHEAIWTPDTTTASNWDSSYAAVKGLLRKPAPLPVVRRPVAPTPKPAVLLRGTFSTAELIKAYPVYAKRRDHYLPNAVMLSRLEALRPAFEVEVRFAPEDSVAQTRIPPLLQIYRAAYLPETVWRFIGDSGRTGEPLVLISHGGEELIRWTRPTEKRMETILFEIADVVRRLRLSQKEN